MQWSQNVRSVSAALLKLELPCSTNLYHFKELMKRPYADFLHHIAIFLLLLFDLLLDLVMDGCHYGFDWRWGWHFEILQSALFDPNPLFRDSHFHGRFVANVGELFRRRTRIPQLQKWSV